eukprot:CAMPEP_0185831764 /NCGR_PEP_ID=MMETSP1353-20130828/1695_1 /TAXON_ID=1077150 /ORGANISM="Erythrolobus australicus, Strain CCMP3124" /LENGTH=191 /DNA_ID=CAMNT_0028529871 /DNA_START=65 /DNA_END=640 /DNA_ORIENTATION=+
MTASVLVPLADRSEELEAVAIINILRRAGCTVTVARVAASSDSLAVTCAREVTLQCDAQLEDALCTEYDLIVLPGGMPGAQTLGDAPRLIEKLRSQRDRGAWYGAICAAPAVALLPHELLPATATCHPSMHSKLADAGVAAAALASRVVVDSEARCVTSQGAGTAIEFALKLVELIVDDATARRVAEAIVH